MGLQHGYLTTEDTQPTTSEVKRSELVVNLADKTIYTKDHNGAIISVGGGGGGDVTCTIPILKKLQKEEE